MKRWGWWIGLALLLNGCQHDPVTSAATPAEGDAYEITCEAGRLSLKNTTISEQWETLEAYKSGKPDDPLREVWQRCDMAASPF